MFFPSFSQDNTTDYNLDTWLSLVGLLQPAEFFVTVDHTNLWRKHVTWSKSNGGDLRKYTIERFSSNMVFLSLMLTADVSVLFNSAQPCSDMRQSMLNAQYLNLDYWTGSVIVLSACVTVLALVATFTAWGMVSSVSDVNSHCMLRSNIGQYVTSLPSRLVVASLYLFLLWLILFVIEFIGGPFLYIVVGLVAYLFFQIVVPLSTFGRLIIHTGAMGERPVLDPDFERSLLPSGLHASLLIKATARKRGRKDVMEMYRRQIASMSPRNSIHGSSSSVRSDDNTPFPGSYGTAESVAPSLDPDEERGTASSNSKSATNEETKPPLGRRNDFSHHRVLSTDITSFPLPEILNKKVSKHELNTIVEMTLNNPDEEHASLRGHHKALGDSQRSSAKPQSSTATTRSTPRKRTPSLTSPNHIVSTPLASSSSTRKSTSRTDGFSHHRVLSTDVTSFPLPEILNKKVSKRELNTIVEMTLNNQDAEHSSLQGHQNALGDSQRSSAKPQESTATASSNPTIITPSLTSPNSIISAPLASGASTRKSTIQTDGFETRSVESRPPRPTTPFQSTIDSGAFEPRPESRHRRTMSPFQHPAMPHGLPLHAPLASLRRKDRRRVRAEWAEDVDVRDMYDATPPALDITELDQEETSTPTHRRRNSFLHSLFNAPISAASQDEEAINPLRDNTESGERDYLLSNEQFSDMLNQSNR